MFTASNQTSDGLRLSKPPNCYKRSSQANDSSMCRTPKLTPGSFSFEVAFVVKHAITANRSSLKTKNIYS